MRLYQFEIKNTLQFLLVLVLVFLFYMINATINEFHGFWLQRRNILDEDWDKRRERVENRWKAFAGMRLVSER